MDIAEQPLRQPAIDSIARHRARVLADHIGSWHPLPPKVTPKNGALYYVHKNKWHWLGRTATEAKASYIRVLGELGLPYVGSAFLDKLWDRARRRALRKRVPFSLTKDDVRQMWDEAGGKCALTSLPFDETNTARFARRPWVPSLDRKDAKLGYTKENARLVCTAINFAMNSWGEENFEKVARAFLERHPKGDAR
jgi:hypothetical protein